MNKTLWPSFSDLKIGDQFRFPNLTSLGGPPPLFIKVTKSTYYDPKAGRTFRTGARTAVLRMDEINELLSDRTSAIIEHEERLKRLLGIKA